MRAMKSALKVSTSLTLKDIAVNGQTFTYFDKKCRISARTLNI